MESSGDESQDHGSDGPEPFVAYGVSPEERQAMLDAVGAALPTAGPDFGATVAALADAATGVASFKLMGAMAYYLGSAEAGTNPEHDRPLEIYQHHLELAQAVLFRGGTAENAGPPSAHVERLANAITSYNRAWMLLQLLSVERAQTEQSRALEVLLLRLRLHASTNRGWAYESRMDAMLRALLEPLSSLREELGFAPADLPSCWGAMRTVINSRLHQHRRDVAEALNWPVDENWARRVAERFGALPEPVEGGWTEVARASEDARLYYVINCADFRVHEIYRFTLDELVEIWPHEVLPSTVRSVVERWAIRPGDDYGVRMQNLPLDNPVVGRPFVADDDDAWYLFCAWLPLHNPFQLIEHALEGHDQALSIYQDRRSEFLEERLAELLAAGLPGATIEKSLYSTDPTDDKEYENDVLALISSFAVVAEAKSGAIHPEARRGRPRILRERLRELVVRPSEQALRLARRFESATDDIEFRRADGSQFVAKAGEIRHTLTLAVTLEPIADLLPRLSDIAGAGLSARAAEALSYNINILDLELVVDLLEHPSEVLHYLGRRSEIEQAKFLTGDEVDLLALYLETGFNLGEHEFDNEHTLDVTGLSDEIDVWQYRLEAGMDAQKPRAARTPWWDRVLSRVERRTNPRWAEAGVTMCNVAPPEQQEFEDALIELRRAIVAGERPPTDLIAFHNGPPQRRDLFVGVIATSSDPEERAEQYSSSIGVATEGEELTRAILLAWTPEPISEPYFALAVYDVTA